MNTSEFFFQTKTGNYNFSNIDMDVNHLEEIQNTILLYEKNKVQNKMNQKRNIELVVSETFKGIEKVLHQTKVEGKIVYVGNTWLDEQGNIVMAGVPLLEKGIITIHDGKVLNATLGILERDFYFNESDRRWHI